MENQEKKETYQQKIQEQLDEWRADIDRLKEMPKPNQSSNTRKTLTSLRSRWTKASRN